jgi:hypothetical protein
MRELAGDAELRRRLGARARQYVCDERRWSALAGVYRETYEKLL